MDWNTLAGVVIGAALTYVIQRVIRQDDRALNARLELTSTLNVLWADTGHQLLMTHLHRTKVHLEDAHVGQDLIREWEEAAVACWRDSRDNYETDPVGEYWMSTELLDAYQALEAKIHDALRRRRWWSGSK